ncbi:hypothetical protein [Lampropedia aestuarii]|uniref:hypothetical protein n=1 Tax=Lampropedia aestuarii TaxID=2562762 RepID=UPI002468FFF0|nr:hypothetical protein [Lampropedia aestuarii]MDH5856169.1 hypothetical protein [Lampropedia aestuarii]
MTDKTLPTRATLAPASQALRVAIKPVFRRLWQRLLAGGRNPSAGRTSIDLPAAHSTEHYLKRGHWLLAQQGSCTIILPMQWQAEWVVQRQQVVHEGDAWLVPVSGYYQLSQRAGPQAAASGRVVICKAR